MPVIELSNSHLIIDARITAQILGPKSHLNLVYYTKYNSIFLASATDETLRAEAAKHLQQLLQLKTDDNDQNREAYRVHQAVAHSSMPYD